MGLHAHVGGGPRRLRAQHLGHVGLGAARQVGLVQRSGLAHHQVGRLGLGIGARDGILHALVLADRPAEQLALLGVIGRLLDEPARIADAFGGDQHALGIHAAQDVAEALPFLTYKVLGRHFHVIEEHLGAVVVHHGADGPDGEAFA